MHCVAVQPWVEAEAWQASDRRIGKAEGQVGDDRGAKQRAQEENQGKQGQGRLGAARTAKPEPVRTHSLLQEQLERVDNRAHAHCLMIQGFFCSIAFEALKF